MHRMWAAIQSWRARDEGASIVEYSLLVALIAVVAIIAIATLGDSLSETYSEIAETIP